MGRLVRGKARREDGQALIIVTLALVILLAIAGFAIDLGRVYVAQRQLQQAVDASTLAAAQDMPNTTVAAQTVQTYSAAGTGKNKQPGLNAAAAVAKFGCIAPYKNPTNPDGTPNPNYVACRVDNTPGAQSPCNSPPGCNGVTVTESADVQPTLLKALNAVGIGVPTFHTVSASSTALMLGGVPHPIDMMVIIDATGSMTSACNYAVGTGSAPQGIPANKSTNLDCAKEGVRSLLQTLMPCAQGVLDCDGQPPIDKVGLEIFPGLNDPNGINHDTGFSLPNSILEAGCPGGLTTSPTWYVTNEAQIVTLTGATGGTFTLKFTNGTTQTTAPIAWNASALDVQTALRNLSNIGSQNVSVTARFNGGPYTVLFGGTLLGSKNLAQMTTTSALAPGTATVAVTTDANGSTPSFPANWFLQSDDTGYSSSSGFQIAPLSNDYRVNDATTTLNPASPLVDTVSWDACPTGSDGLPDYPGNYRYGAAALNRPPGAGGTGTSSGAYTYLASAINNAALTLAANAGADRAQPVIVLLSDGDANYEPPGATAFEPCHEAVTAAQNAANLGIWVYSIAYNSSQNPATSTPISTNGSGAASCQLHVTGFPTDQNDPGGKLNGFTTMYSIARNSTNPNAPDPTKFYCLPAINGVCQDGNATTLATIFTDIGNDVTSKQRLVSG